MVGAFKISAFGQCAHAGGRDARRLSEVELLERLDPGQVRLLHPLLDAASLPIFHLSLKQVFERVQVGVRKILDTTEAAQLARISDPEEFVRGHADLESKSRFPNLHSPDCGVDLSPFLTQTVKTQNRRMEN